MYRLAKEKLAAAGYEHYEISSWARPGFYSRHNSDCWRMVDYRGLGSAAHSFSRRPGPQRSANVEDPAAYISRLESGKSPRESEEEIQPSAYAGEALMLGLRLREGVSQESYRREHGDDPAALFPEAMELGFRNGWLESRHGMLRLTDEGLLFSNEIFVHLF
jgi:oxygen-independent coproporphyrinogen-3 oxidase